MRIKGFTAIFLGLALVGFIFNIYVGYYYSYIDHDEHEVYFLKKIPTFRREFVNPFANESDPKSVDELSIEVRKELSDYCKYAYGITLNDSKSLGGCREKILQETGPST